MALSVEARRYGPTTGLPLVALPGLNDGLVPLWDAPAAPPPPAFADDPVVVLSYPRDVGGEPTTRSLAEHLGAYLEEHVGPCVVSGHSMGAMVALHLAADRPGLVRGLILSAAVAVSDADVDQVLRRWERLLAAGAFDAFHRDAIAVAYAGGERERRLALFEAMGAPPPTPERVRRHLALSHAARTHDASDRLSAIAAPALVLAGEQDPLTRPAASRRLADALPDARFEVVPGVAHGFPEQAAVRYTDALDHFIHRELTVADRT